MAVPDGRAQAAHTVPGRNPRRRQRNDSTEALTLQAQPKRKRSKVSEDFFESPLKLVQTQKDVTSDQEVIIDADIPRHSVEIPTRTKPVKRASRHEDQWTLARTLNYTARLIPNLPDPLRTNSFRGTLPVSSRLALALTHNHAYIWDRSSSAASPVSRKFDLPQDAQPGALLPFGSLVKTGTVQKTGLVVVLAASAKIIFWENVENADALSLFERRRNGLEGSLTGLFSGESVVRLESVDHAGFIIILSSGRVAHLTLRDAQSKPAVNVKFLKGGPQPARTGLFGGLTNVLSGGTWLRNVVAARSRLSSVRGHMQLLLANEDARFQFWQLGWSGHAEFVAETDAQQQVVKEIRRECQVSAQDSLTVKVIDFSFVQDAHTNSENNDGSARIVALAAASGTSSLCYVLAELLVSGEDAAVVKRVIRLDSYAPTLLPDKHAKPGLVVSDSGKTAFAVFEKAVTIVSLATLEASPDSQLAVDTESMPQPFQDTLYLRDDDDLVFTGTDSDRSGSATHSSAIALFVKSQGLIRLVAQEPEQGRLALERYPVTVKGRIQQNVFYGSKPDNPLHLAKSSRIEASLDQIEKAALEVSLDILTSEGQGSGEVDVDVANHLAERGHKLKNLALHIKHNYPPLSRKTRWLLSSDGEKLAAAEATWKLYQEQLADGVAEGKLLTELINMMDDRYNSAMDASKGETDEVRHWFVKHVNHMGDLIMWMYQSFFEMVTNEMQDTSPQVLAPLVHQADQFVIASLAAAVDFRVKSAWDYNIDGEVAAEGLPRESHDDLPVLWTSQWSLMDKMQELIKNARDLVVEGRASDLEEDLPILEQIASEVPSLVDAVCRCWEERLKWHRGSADQTSREVAHQVEQVYAEKRTKMMVRLHDIDQTDEGFRLGEKYRDMHALVRLFRREVLDAQRFTSPGQPPELQEQGRSMLIKLSTLERRWFSRFGQEWADTFYSGLIKNEQYGQLLNQARNTRRDLTRFLRAEHSRRKISWINDVLSERDYAHSAKTLLGVADAGGQTSWCQRVDLSLAKLSLLASTEGSEDRQAAEPSANALLSRCERELSLAQIKQSVYEMLHAAGVGALDEQAEMALIMDAYAASRSGSALGELLTRAVEALMQGSGPSVEQLLDLLTLVDRKPAPKSESPDLSEEVYVLALEALHHCEAELEPELFKLLAASTWRRILIQDDWHSINNTEHKSDVLLAATLQSTCLFQTLLSASKKSWWKQDDEQIVPEASDIIGVGSTIEGLQPRFADETIRRHVAKEVKQEDEVLQSYVERDRLEHWLALTKHLVEDRLADDADDKKEVERAVRSASARARGASRMARGSNT